MLGKGVAILAHAESGAAAVHRQNAYAARMMNDLTEAGPAVRQLGLIEGHVYDDPVVPVDLPQFLF